MDQGKIRFTNAAEGVSVNPEWYIDHGERRDLSRAQSTNLKSNNALSTPRDRNRPDPRADIRTEADGLAYTPLT